MSASVVTSPIPPKDIRHHKFADGVLRGLSLTDAYLEAGYKTTRKAAGINSQRTRNRRDVDAYIAAVQAAAVDDSVMTVLEKRRFLARIKRTALIAIDPTNPEDPNADLVKKIRIREGEEGTSTDYEKLDPLKAIEMDNKLSGDDPESTAMGALAAAISALAPGTPLPEDRM